MRFALLALALILAGCTATPPARPASAVAWPERRQQLQLLDQWMLAGRVAVSQGGEGWSAALDWHQARGASTIDVRGPFGAGAARITIEADRATFDDGSGAAVFTENFEADLGARLGVRLPVRALRYWLLGVPDPGSAAVEHPGPDGRLAALEQDGWRVEFTRYAATRLGDLPGRIAAASEGVRLRLVVEDWRSDAAPEVR